MTIEGSLELPDSFGVALSFARSQTKLSLRGEVDILTAPEFGAILGGLIDRGHRNIVVDCTELDFMDASGLGVIAVGAARLSAFGMKLAIGSASELLRRLLEITGLATVVLVTQGLPPRDHLGPEQSGASTRGGSESPVVHSLKRITSIPADTDVVDGALRLVVALARATVEGADGVSVSLRRHGRLATVAASDQTILEMDADQYATGEGPCVSASIEGHWFHVESLAEETRWPAFTPRARELGINAILSNPLLVENEPVGALNIYSRSTAPFAVNEQQRAAVFASEASIILADAGAGVSEDEVTAWLQEALHVREVIAQAQGVIMDREGVSEDLAYAHLLHFSRASSRPLHDEATDVVASTKRPPDGSNLPTGPNDG